MAVAYREIARVLDGARRREAGVVLASALGWGAAAVLALLLAGAAVLTWRPGSVVARPASLTLAFAALAAAIGWAGVVLRRRAGAPEAVARALGRREPAIRSDLVSAVELERDSAEIAASRRFSVALVEEHAARTAARVGALDLRRLVPSAVARRALTALAAVALVNGVALVAVGRPLVAGYVRLAGRGPAGPVRVATPITGDVELTYNYPAYMDRPARTVSGTGGEIRAPRGTDVLVKTRADREVREAQLVVQTGAGVGAPAPTSAAQPGPRAGGGAATTGENAIALSVSGGRDLEGHVLVEDGGAYRFQFTRGQKVLAEGPPAPIVVEADAFPEIRIGAPAKEVEVKPGGRVSVDWSASDDWGLGELTLVVKRDGGEEERTKLRDLGGARREGGTHPLDTATMGLREGDRLLYWLEVTDQDSISGPKRGASTTHVLRVYSAAEHRRLAMERAKQLWEALVQHLGERLEFFDPLADLRAWTTARMAQAQVLDGRTRALHERLQQGAGELRRDRAAPKELALALANVAAGLRVAARDASTLREAYARMLPFERAGREPSPLAQRLAEADRKLDQELEKSVLYLEQLLDQQRADDLVRMAKELAQQRRDLAAMAEKVRDAPTEDGKRALLAEVRSMKRRLEELSRRMAELAKGMSDEHMNAEALAEAARAQDAQSGLDDVEQALARGDVDAALKALDRLGNQMEQMVAGMERTARRPGEKNRELARELQALRKELDRLEAEQKQVAADTEREKAIYQGEVEKRLRGAEEKVAQLGKLAEEARRRVEEAKPGATLRSEHDQEAARDRLVELERAIAAKDLDAALDSARRALPPVERLAAGLAEDASIAERFPQPGRKDSGPLRDARDAAARAVPPARAVKEELEKLFPDPRAVMPREAQARMEGQGRQQEELARKASELREQMAKLGERAPIFPPEAGDSLREAQGQMQGAAGELARRDPQRGHGRQRQAMDALARLRAGMEQMAQRQRGQDGRGEGMPMPFAQESGGREDGDAMDPSQEKVEIPGEEAYKAPEAFRKDLMEAMKQGAPEKYRGEVSRYYQELVK